MKTTLIALIVALVATFMLSAGAVGAPSSVRSYTLYYNEFSGLTTIPFAESTSPTALTHPPTYWMLRNPSTTVTFQYISNTSTATTAGTSLPPGAWVDGRSKMPYLRVYSASSTPVELYWESEE